MPPAGPPQPPAAPHQLQVQHAVLGLLQQRHELGGEQPQALLVPTAASAASRFGRRGHAARRAGASGAAPPRHVS